MKKINKILIHSSVLCIILFSILILARNIQKFNFSLKQNEIYLMSSKINPILLEILSGDFKQIVCDFLVLQASQFIGGADNPVLPQDDLENLVDLFARAQWLDPYFFTIPYYVEGSITQNADIAQKTNLILKKSHNTRTWDWEPGFYLGFNLFYYLGKNRAAAKVLQESALRSNAPMIVGFLAAKIDQQSGMTEASIRFLQTMYNVTKNKTLRKKIRKRLKGYKGIFILEKSIRAYHKKFGGYPYSLADLVQTGILKSLPSNPYNNIFLYNPDDGTVSLFPTIPKER